MSEHYDDILFSQEEPGQEQPPAGFDLEEYKEIKQQERDAAFSMIDDTALKLTEAGAVKEYLDVQSRFDLYRPANILLIQAQMPTASRLKGYDQWKTPTTGVRRDNHPILILKQGKQYVREDGSIGQFTNLRKVYDISQTYGTAPLKQPERLEGRALLKALLHKPPVSVMQNDNLPDGMGALYDPDKKAVFVRPGMDAPDIFRAVSLELAHAELHRSMGEDYSRDNAGFAACGASYVLCRLNGVDVSGFHFENAAKQFEGKDAQAIRADLTDIREAMGEIHSRMRQAAEQAKAPKQQEAR